MRSRPLSDKGTRAVFARQLGEQGHRDKRRREPHDVDDREQQDDAHHHCQHEADDARTALLRLREPTGQDRDEDDVVDSEDDLEGREREQGEGRVEAQEGWDSIHRSSSFSHTSSWLVASPGDGLGPTV